MAEIVEDAVDLAVDEVVVTVEDAEEVSQEVVAEVSNTMIVGQFGASLET